MALLPRPARAPRLSEVRSRRSRGGPRAGAVRPYVCSPRSGGLCTAGLCSRRGELQPVGLQGPGRAARLSERLRLCVLHFRMKYLLEVFYSNFFKSKQRPAAGSPGSQSELPVAAGRTPYVRSLA